MFGRLSPLLLRRPRRLLVAVAAFAVLAIALGHDVVDRLAPAGFEDPASESAQLGDRLEGALGHAAEPGMVVLARSDGPIRAPAARREVAQLAGELGRDPFVGRVVDPLAGDVPGQVSRDGRAALIAVHFRGRDETLVTDAVERLQEGVSSQRLELAFGGFGVGFGEVNDTAKSDLVRGELIAFPLLALLLLLVFRGVVAAALPLAVGAVAVVGTFLVLRLLNGVVDVSVFATNMTVSLGLALAVDYGLLLVSRFREELAARGVADDALAATLATAGRTVLYSSLTVAAAMGALTFFPQRFLYSVGAGGALVALLAAASALALVIPALALLGERVNALAVRRPPRTSGRRWERLARAVMRRPVAIGLASAAVLLALAAPAAGVSWTFVGNQALPDDGQAAGVLRVLDRDFPPGIDAPLTVAAGDPGELERARAAAQGHPAIAVVTPTQQAGGTAFFQALPAADPLDEGSEEAVGELRALGVDVGGQTATFVDFKESVVDHAAVPAALIVTTTFALVFLITGSVLLPVKTIAMNLLTIAAVFGLLVLVFQEGMLAGLVGFDGPPAIETATGVLVFALAFGISTDYAVLLLARMKEEHARGRSNQDAVAGGLARTGPVVTAAALILVVAFAAFASSGVFFLKEFAIGMAAAVAIDATVVRALLVPALMRLMGGANWWAPASLRRVHARIGWAEGERPAAAAGRAR